VERIPMSRTMGKLGWWYLWTVIFTLQPHKEERFMFVVYPLLCFNAAICLGAFESLASRITGGRLAKWAIWGVVLGSAAVSLSRVVGLHFYYSAPMEVWARTGDVVREHANSGKLPTRNTDISVCVAKEWHRFSTHYFLPEVSNRRVRLRFLKSSFGGLLPKDWVEDVSGEPWRRGSFTIPKGMNNENREELDRYVGFLASFHGFTHAYQIVCAGRSTFVRLPRRPSTSACPSRPQRSGPRRRHYALGKSTLPSIP
jgi:alpha-1,2-mannosyltransferase